MPYMIAVSLEMSDDPYIRTPSGKYAGKAGLVNFVTVKMNYGGNVYLSANEGFAYKSGEYLAFADFNKKRYTLSLTENITDLVPPVAVVWYRLFHVAARRVSA